jgi:hypothetical protein
MTKRKYLAIMEIESEDFIDPSDLALMLEIGLTERNASVAGVDATVWPSPAAFMADEAEGNVHIGLCDGDQGCDGSGYLPNGERCDLCERQTSDLEKEEKEG